MKSMNCQLATGLYDDWRDHTLGSPEESDLIGHLESCATCSMEFERRDEALEALGRALKGAPGPSAALHMEIRSLGSRRRPWMAYVSAVACLVIGLWLGSTYIGSGISSVSDEDHPMLASWLKRGNSMEEIETRLIQLEETRNNMNTVLAAYEAGRVLERELGDSNLTVHRGRLGSMVTVLRGDDPDPASFEALRQDRRDLRQALDPLLVSDERSDLGTKRQDSKLAPEMVSAIVRELVKKKDRRKRDPFEGGVQ